MPASRLLGSGAARKPQRTAPTGVWSRGDTKSGDRRGGPELRRGTAPAGGRPGRRRRRAHGPGIPAGGPGAAARMCPRPACGRPGTGQGREDVVGWGPGYSPGAGLQPRPT